MYLDLSEVSQVFALSRFWSASRPAPAWFRRADYFGPASLPLDECVREEVQRQTGRRPDGPVRLLTHLRYFGLRMNPVSFFYCFDRSGQKVDAVLAEVSNTPWGERHLYVLDRPCSRPGQSPVNVQQQKHFHVSPFMPMHMVYHFQLNVPDERLRIHIRSLHQESEERSAESDPPRPFDVTMLMRRQEISQAALIRILLRHPCMTLKVVSAIYWQAMKLWSKGTPYFPHPVRPSHSSVLTTKR